MRAAAVSVPLFIVAACACAEGHYSAALSLQDGDGSEVAPAQSIEYGQPGQWWWTIAGGGGASLNNGDASAAFIVGASTFLAEDFELSLDLTAWYLGDDALNSDDALAINLNPKLRWHFLHGEAHTVFAEAGVGLLLATEETPEGGSEFNFTPQAGLGATFELSEGPERLIVGVNWRHISNANVFGSDRNPGRDDIFAYVGVTFPF